jgi:hypothetical protein
MPVNLRQQQGMVLATCLMLMLTLTSLTLMTADDARLSLMQANNVQHAAQAWQQARNAISESVSFLAAHPETLNSNTNQQLENLASSQSGPMTSRVRFRASDQQCPQHPELDRLHFEIQAIGFAPRDTRAHQVQGFYVCRSPENAVSIDYFSEDGAFPNPDGSELDSIAEDSPTSEPSLNSNEDCSENCASDSSPERLVLTYWFPTDGFPD